MKEVIVRLRDDLDNKLDGSIDTYTWTWIDGKTYEIDLRAENLAKMEQDMLPYLKAGREAKRKKGKGSKAKVSGDGGPKRQSSQWYTEIGGWATEHGYDWDDVNQRRTVREWAFEHTDYQGRSGVLPKYVLEAHYEAVQNGSAPWPFEVK